MNFGKGYGTAAYPVHAYQTSGLLKRAEPFLTPEKLKSRFLKGIPLAFPNGEVISADDLKDKIMLAMNEVEILLNRTVTREAFQQKVPFDKSLYDAFIHVRTEHGPIISIEQLAITSANGESLFEIPVEWIETANFTKNLINVIPMLSAQSHTIHSAGGPGGLAFLSTLGGLSWVPAYWQVKYTAGMTTKEGQVPVPVNELIGVIAAMDVLSLIAPSNIYNSQSLSQDGISQSSSGPGPNVYNKRLEDLEMKKEELVKKLKGIFSSRYFIDNI